MSATKYNLTLVGVNKMSPALTGAAADAKDLTTLLREQRQEAKKLNAAQKELAAYTELRKGLAATRHALKETQGRIKGLAAEQRQSQVRVSELSREHKLAAQNVDRMARALSNTETPTAEMSDAFRLAQRQASQLGEQLEQEQTQLIRISRKFEQAKVDAKSLKDAFHHQRNELHKLGGELRKAGVDTGNFGREQSRLKREVEASNKALEAQKVQLKNLKIARSRMAAADTRMADVQSETAGAAAMLATAVIPIARAVTMEAAMANVTKVVSFEGREETDFQSHLQRLAVDVNIPPEQLTQIAAAAGQSGIEKNDLAGFTAAAARMGVAFDMEAAEAGETMAAWRAGMGLNQQQAEQLADAVNHVSNNMNAKARDISGVLKRQGAVATASGMTETQTASLAGALLAGGASEEVAATTLKNLLGALTKGEAATSSQKIALSELGLDSGALAFDMQTDAVGTVKEVFAALTDAPLEKQSALISQIFGEESKGGIMPLLKNQQLLQQAFELTSKKSEYENSALEEYENRASVSEHRLGSAWRAVDRLGLVLGTSILPIVGPLADGVAWAAGGLADLAEAGGWVTSTVTGLAAAYVGYKTLMFGWQLASAKVEQWRARSALETAEKETRLAMATDDTAEKAGIATRALNRFNDALGRTGRLQPRGRNASDVDLPESRQGRRRQRASRSRGRRGRLARLAGSGATAVRGLGAVAVDHTLELFSGAAGIAGLVSLAGLVGSHWDGAGSKNEGAETVSLSFIDQAKTLVSSVVDYATERVRALTGGRSVMEGLSDTMGFASDLTGTASDVLGSLSSTVVNGASHVFGLAAKAIRPVDTLLQGGNLISAVSSGDNVEVAATVGDIVGGWSGAAGGAAAGAAIGSIVPVIGTGIGAAIGAGLGGWFGGDAGSWAATKVMEWFRSDSENETNSAANQTLIADQSSSSTAESSAESTQTNAVSHLNTELKTALKTELRDTPLKQQLAEADAEAGSVITGSALQQINSEIDQSSRGASVADSSQQNIQFSPQITIHAPSGVNAEQVAELAVQKMQALFNTHLMPAFSPTLGGRIDDSMEIMS